MNAIYLFGFRRRIEQQWAERIKALSQIHSQFIVATTRTLQNVLNNDGSLIPVAVRTVQQRQIDRA